MNSVSMPSRPSSRARAASRASSDTEHLLPPLRSAHGHHADGLEQPGGGSGGAVHRRLGVAQAPAPERVEQQQEQRAPVALAPGAVRDGERRDDARAPLAGGALLP